MTERQERISLLQAPLQRHLEDGFLWCNHLLKSYRRVNDFKTMNLKLVQKLSAQHTSYQGSQYSNERTSAGIIGP